jgi:hypothetical protein
MPSTGVATSVFHLENINKSQRIWDDGYKTEQARVAILEAHFEHLPWVLSQKARAVRLETP